MEDELVKLNTVYAPPGFLLLATRSDGSRAGCVGLRPIDDDNTIGEMRRLFVRENDRGQKSGRRLAVAAIERARGAGFERVVLNTLPAMNVALQLYQELGFARSEPHVDEPAEGTLYFSLDLTTTPPR